MVYLSSCNKNKRMPAIVNHWQWTLQTLTANPASKATWRQSFRILLFWASSSCEFFCSICHILYVSTTFQALWFVTPIDTWFFVNLNLWNYFWFKMNLFQFQVYILRTLCSHKNRNSQWDIALLDTKTIYHDVYKLIWYNWNLFWLKIYENN